MMMMIIIVFDYMCIVYIRPATYGGIITLNTAARHRRRCVFELLKYWPNGSYYYYYY